MEACHTASSWSVYTDGVKKALSSVDHTEWSRAAKLIRRAEHIYVAGNGGSAAVSGHLQCDFMKGAFTSPVINLAANIPLLTAISNDYGYESTFHYQLVYYKASQKDVLILISSSGNSENILLAASNALTIGMPIIAMTGFTGGKLASMLTKRDVHIHVDSSNYGVIEDVHSMCMHSWSQAFICEDEENDNIHRRDVSQAV